MQWVLLYPLRTVRRMMYLTFPQTAIYVFHDRQTKPRDENSIRWVVWGPSDLDITRAADMNRPRVTVLVQPPWLLTEQDLRSFAACTSVSVLFAITPTTPCRPVLLLSFRMVAPTLGSL